VLAKCSARLPHGEYRNVKLLRSYATTLFDYIRRSMPFTAPGSLTADEIYAVSAYILSEANITDKSTVLDARMLSRVEMPNRDGFVPDPRPDRFK
jgi:S-disulfanyl-L-cysteine oxidoreductase SoxD